MSPRVPSCPAIQRGRETTDVPYMLEHDWFPDPLGDHVEIGSGSWVHSSYGFLHDRSTRRVSIGRHSGVYVTTFFDLGPEGQVEIGDYCAIVGAIFATNG